jgi:single-stranded-DNA-specific exonuclease
MDLPHLARLLEKANRGLPQAGCGLDKESHVQATRSRWVNLQQESVPDPRFDRASIALSPLVAQIVQNRGICAADLKGFLCPNRFTGYDPYLLLGMRRAIDRLLAARRSGELVAVYGDFDVDGITSTALLVQALTKTGIAVIPYIPHRKSEGSGLRCSALDGLVAQGVRLIITVDCGVSSGPEVARVAAAGIDVIITDHHCPPANLPLAYAIVNPQQEACSYPFKELAGVGVAYKVARALLGACGMPSLLDRELLDLVAVGTIADMVPLVGENRSLVWHGLQVLNATARPGFQALITRSGLRLGGINSTDVGHRLCPRLNAAGRLDHASLGYELIMSKSYEDADALARRLEEKNAERQVLTQQALAAVRDDLEQRPALEKQWLLVLEIAPWAADVMGLLAGKIVEEYGKPVVVLQRCGLEVRGSVRGTPAFGMLDALRANADLLDRFGGHQLAAGFTTKPACVRVLTDRLREQAAACLCARDLLPTLRIDAEVPLHELTWQLYDQLQALEPCGVGNPLPLFLCKRLRLLEYRKVGNNHLRLAVGKGHLRIPAILFRRADLAQYLRRYMEVDVVFNLEANDYNGSRNLQLKVRDLAFEPACRQELGLDLKANALS